MSKFVLLMVAVFAVFFVGGMILIDNGIVANGHVERLPIAVAMQDSAVQVWNTLVNLASRVYLFLKPALDIILGFLSPLLNMATGPNI